jgi:hypothetical protein
MARVPLADWLKLEGTFSVVAGIIVVVGALRLRRAAGTLVTGA